MNKLFLIGLGIVGWIAYQKYNLAKKINIAFKNFSFVGGTFLKPIVNIELKLFNPTTTTSDIQKITGEIYLQNNVVGTIYQDINQKILASQTTVINFNINLNLENAAIILITNKFQNQILELKGSLLIDFVNFPINYQIKIP